MTAWLRHWPTWRATGDARERDVRRVRRFVDGVPARVTVAFAPEIAPGTPSLAALGRLANFLLMPQTIVERPVRRANADAPLKGRMPLKGGRRAGKNQTAEVGRMPE